MSIAELPPATSSTAVRTSSPWQRDINTMDHDLEALHRAMDEARATSWRTGDAIEAEFENFISVITRPVHPARLSDSLAPAPAFTQRNTWRDTIEAWDSVVDA